MILMRVRRVVVKDRRTIQIKQLILIIFNSPFLLFPQQNDEMKDKFAAREYLPLGGAHASKHMLRGFCCCSCSP